jgi:hypothetical protein
VKPIDFPKANRTYAKDQPEYLPLRAHVKEDGTATTCWKPSFVERLKILLGGNVWIQILTFNKPLQPLLPSIDPPEQVK